MDLAPRVLVLPRVCKAWNKVNYEISITVNIKHVRSIHTNAVAPENLAWLRRFENVESVAVFPSTFSKGEKLLIFDFISRRKSQIRKLKIIDLFCKSDTVNELAACLGNLDKLVALSFRVDNLADIRIIYNNILSLQRLELEIGKDADIRELAKAVTSIAHMRHFAVDDVDGGLRVESLFPDSVLASLESLTVTSRIDYKDTFFASGGLLEYLANEGRKCKMLSLVTLNCPLPGEILIHKFLRSLPSLESVEITGTKMKFETVTELLGEFSDKIISFRLPPYTPKGGEDKAAALLKKYGRLSGGKHPKTSPKGSPVTSPRGHQTEEEIMSFLAVLDHCKRLRNTGVDFVTNASNAIKPSFYTDYWVPMVTILAPQLTTLFLTDAAVKAFQSKNRKSLTRVASLKVISNHHPIELTELLPCPERVKSVRVMIDQPQFTELEIISYIGRVLSTFPHLEELSILKGVDRNESADIALSELKATDTGARELALILKKHKYHECFRKLTLQVFLKFHVAKKLYGAVLREHEDLRWFEVEL